jgi:hypothetical protein
VDLKDEEEIVLVIIYSSMYRNLTGVPQHLGIYHCADMHRPGIYVGSKTNACKGRLVTS